MLNKSNSEKSTCKYFNKSQNSSSNLITNSNSQKKSSSSKIKKSKLNTILNRTLSDSVLNKKSTYFSNPWHHHKKQTCLSRKNSTNRRSLIYNPNSTLFNQNFLYSNNSTNRISFYTSASAGPQSPSVFSNQSPVPNIFSNQNSIHNINQYNNLRNKLKQHRSSCCVVNNTSNNLSQQLDPYENNNFSLSSSICSSLSPSPITLVNRQNSLVLSTPPSNINLNFPTSSKNSQPVSSPLSLTPASALEQRKSINNVKQSSILVSSKSKRDSRRWSLASMHSSDCNTAMNTPKMISSLPPSFQQQSSSAVPSQYSSSTYLNDNISSNKKILQNQKSYSDQSNIPLNSKNSSDSLKHCKSEENQIEYSQRLSFGGRRRRLSSSNESSHLDDSSDVGFSSPLSFHRQRARSLSCSPCKGLNDSDIAPTEKFKEKFPKACKQLEENLQLFIDLNKIDLNTSTCSMGSNDNQNNSSNSKNSKYYVSQPSSLDPAARFIQNQVIEIAKLCLEKSKSNQLTCSYLDEMTSSLEKLLLEARDKCCQVELSVEYLHKFIKKFLFIISHVARLLECIEFDPLEFSHFLDCAEQQAKQQEIKTDIPKYIISKLGIDRDPIKELNNEEEVIHSLNRTNSLTSRTSTSGFSGDDFLPSDFSLTTNGSLKSESNAPVVAPSQDDFEEVKIISNGAYGQGEFLIHKPTFSGDFDNYEIWCVLDEQYLQKYEPVLLSTGERCHQSADVLAQYTANKAEFLLVKVEEKGKTENNNIVVGVLPEFEPKNNPKIAAALLPNNNVAAVESTTNETIATEAQNANVVVVTYDDLKSAFDVFVQVMSSQYLNGEFLLKIKEIHDEYFKPSIEFIETILTEKYNLLFNCVCNFVINLNNKLKMCFGEGKTYVELKEDFKYLLEHKPKLLIQKVAFDNVQIQKLKKCESFNFFYDISTNGSAIGLDDSVLNVNYLVQFSGNLYDSDTLVPLAGTNLNDKQFLVCAKMCNFVNLLHSLKHFKIAYLEICSQKIESIKIQLNSTNSLNTNPTDENNSNTEILNYCLADNQWLLEMFEKFKQLLFDVDNLITNESSNGSLNSQQDKHLKEGTNQTQQVNGL